MWITLNHKICLMNHKIWIKKKSEKLNLCKVKVYKNNNNFIRSLQNIK
jgi:hypothetical protein